MSLNQTVRVTILDTREFKKGYQTITNLVKDEKSILLMDPHKIVNRWINYFCRQLNVHREGSITQTEIDSKAVCARA
jgi:hypothetical protein